MDLRCNLIFNFAPQDLHIFVFEHVHSKCKHIGASQTVMIHDIHGMRMNIIANEKVIEWLQAIYAIIYYD